MLTALVALVTGLGAAGAPNEPPKITRADLAQIGETAAERLCACATRACGDEVHRAFVRDFSSALGDGPVDGLTFEALGMEAVVHRMAICGTLLETGHDTRDGLARAAADQTCKCIGEDCLRRVDTAYRALVANRAKAGMDDEREALRDRAVAKADARSKACQAIVRAAAGGMEKVADTTQAQMCACADAACASSVLDSFAAVVLPIGMERAAPASDALFERVAAAHRKRDACLERLVAKATEDQAIALEASTEAARTAAAAWKKRRQLAKPGDAAEAVAVTVQVADAICACPDLACAQKASQRFAELSPRGSEQDLSSEDVARLTEAVRKMQACLDRLVEEHGSGGR